MNYVPFPIAPALDNTYNRMQRIGKEAGFPVQVCECHSPGLGIPSSLAGTRYFYYTISLLCYLLQLLSKSLPPATGKSINKRWRPHVEVGGSREEASPRVESDSLPRSEVSWLELLLQQ